MSAAVTEPNSLPSSPTRAENVSDTSSSFVAIPCGRAATLVLGGLEARLLLRDALQVARRRRVGDAAREQVVAGVAGRDLHDVAGVPELLDRLAKMTSMCDSSRYVVGRGRLRQSSQVSPRPSPRANTPSSGHMKMASAISQRYHETPWCEEPRQYPESAQRVQRAEEHEQVESRHAKRRQRRNDDSGDAGDQPPHELVVEAKFPQRRERWTDARATQR